MRHPHPFRPGPARRGSLTLLLAAGAVVLVGTGPVGAQEPDDDPAARWEFFLAQRRFPGTEALGARLQAARQALLTRPRLAAAPGAAGIGGGAWTALGPQRIPIFSASTGRIADVKLHPGDPDILFVGGAQGGVWRSADGGGSWQPLTDQECSLAMGAVAVDPVNPDIVYAGTGEQHFSGDSYYGCGILRSTDGGAGWTRLGAAVFTHPRGGGAQIARLLIDPVTAGTTTSTVLWAATSWGLFRSSDSGATWTLVLEGYITDLVRDPDDPTVLHAATFGDGIFRSSNGGLTWLHEALTPAGEIGRINLAIAPSDGDVLFAAVADRSEGDLLGIWRSRDGGSTWQLRPATGASCRPQCWYDLTLAVHPTDPTVLYFGGVSLFRSDDGGLSFTDIRGFIHVDQHMITVDARRPDWVWVANDGGVYRSTDRGATWASLNTDLALTQFYGGMSVDPSGVEGVLGGTQDNGTVQYEGGPEWAPVLGGDGGFTAIHPLEDIRWMETQWGGSYSGPRRSVAGGPALQMVDGIDLGEGGLFIPPLVMDPFDPTVLYFGTRRLYRTRDDGWSWEVIANGFRDDALVSAIGPARADADVVYVATSRGSVSVTRDGGATWTEANAGLPVRYPTDLAVHPTDPGTAWLTLSGFGSGHVFVTHDFGGSWTDVTGDLPDHPVNAVLLDPADPEQVYIGTDLGVFASAGGGSWARLGTGLPMVAVFDLAAEPNAGALVAATHGRGAFYLPIAAPLELQLRSSTVAQTVPGGGGPVGGEVAVGVYGTGWPTAGWTATQEGAGWLTLTGASGAGRGAFGWSMAQGELWPGTYEETVTVTLDGAAADPSPTSPAPGGPRAAAGGSGTAVVVTLRMDLEATHVATLDATTRTVEVPLGAAETVADSAGVSLEGPDVANTAWVARPDAAPPWLTLVDSASTGGGTIRWTVDPTGLPVGEYVDTLRVGGLAVAPVPLEIALTVAEPLLVAVGAPSRSVGAWVGGDEAVPDSLDVAVTGYRSATTEWTASHGGGAWLTLGDSTGTGTGRIRWAVDPTGLAEGIYVDTITVEGEDFGALQVVDSLLVREPPAVVVGDPVTSRSLAVSGLLEPIADSALVEITGYGAAEATWVAEHDGAPWLELVRGEGGTGERLAWRRSAAGVEAGTHVASITVRVPGSPSPPIVLVDTLAVEPAVARSDAAGELLVGGLLTSGQRQVLDRLGNGDGTYDLGDFLAWIERCDGGGASCPASSPSSDTRSGGGGGR